MLATRAKTKKNLKKIEKTTEIKPENNQSRRDRANSDFFGFIFVVFSIFFRDFFVFARVANIIFQFLHKVPVPSKG